MMIHRMDCVLSIIAIRLSDVMSRIQLPFFSPMKSMIY